jgi:acyl-CoA oxidase
MEPNVKAFLPLLWLAWSDDLLTGAEWEALNRFLGVQDWLGAPAAAELASYADTGHPPTRDMLSHWKTVLLEAALESNATDIFSLSYYISGHNQKLLEVKDTFLAVEHTLGISGAEAIKTFRSPVDTLTGRHRTVYRFDPRALQAILDGSQANVIREVKAVISQDIFAYDDATDIAAYREKVMEWCRILAAHQFGNRAFPEAYGGGNDMEAYFAIMETLSYHDLSLVIKFGVQFGLWGMSVFFLGTEKHHARYLREIGSLALPGCFAMTETHHGSNVKGLETTATYDREKKTFTIHTPTPADQKEYIGNAAIHGRMATVFAKLILDGKDYGVNAFIVPLRDAENRLAEGVSIGDCGLKMGLNGVDNGTIRFDRVVIPKENMLDRFASISDDGVFESPIASDNRRFFTMLGTLVGGRIGIPRSALSAAKSGLTIAIRYGDSRRQFGPEGGSEIPVLNYRTHQKRLFPKLAKAYALHFTLHYLTNRFIHRQETDIQEIEALAAGLKAQTTWFTRDTLQECREAMGGKGYLSENRIDALKNDTEIYTTFEGDNTVLMQLTAKSRLSAFRKSFAAMSVPEIISYVADRARITVTEKNAVATRRTDEKHLLDPEFHRHAFEYRERTMAASAARRLKKLIDNGLDPYDAFNVAQQHMIDMGAAYLDRVILEQFQEAVQRVAEPELKAVLEKLCALYALSELEEHKAWFLEDGYMEAPKTKAIRKLASQLCWDIRPDALPLTDAFGIPESCLGAPVARRKD